MFKRKRRKRQTMIYKTLHRKLKSGGPFMNTVSVISKALHRKLKTGSIS
jgi:hypothetical protein